MICVRCNREEIQPPWFNKTEEQLEALSKGMLMAGPTPEGVGHGSYAIDEVVRFRRGLCWGCGYDERYARQQQQIAEARALQVARDAMANEGGRCSA